MRWSHADAENVFIGLGRYVMPIYRYESKHNRPYLIGTGVPYSDGSRLYIITAGHVLDELPDRTLITTGSEQLLRFPFTAGQISGGRPGTVDADVAIIEVPKEVVENLARRFHFTTEQDVGELLPYHKRTLYCLVGYPHSRNKPTPKVFDTITAQPFYILLREFVDIDTFTKSGKRQVAHFALEGRLKDLTTIDGQPSSAFSLRGISGGGFWRINFDPRTGAISSPVLTGIMIEYHREKSAFIGTRIGCPLALLYTMRQQS